MDKRANLNYLVEKGLETSMQIHNLCSKKYY